MIQDTLSRMLRPVKNKVPQIAIIFWITKILTTGMGETTSDFFVKNTNPAIAIGLAGMLLAFSLYLQFKAGQYIPWVYWFAVIMVSVFGTMAADVLHVGLGIPYIVSTIFFLILLLFIFMVWYANENTLSVHSIYTRRREIFYWLTVLTTFALGTAVGDMTATTLHLGYLNSGFVFTSLIILPALAYWWFDLNEVAAFWIAYILTRPLGASFADWAGVSHARGGLNWGTGSVSLALFGIIFCLVGIVTMRTRKTILPA